MYIDGMLAHTIPYAPDYVVTRNAKFYRTTFRNNGSYFPITPREVKQKKHRNGYKYIQFHKNGKVLYRYVHRVMLEIFRSSCPEGFEACHLNNIRDDNRVENLKWVTKYENESHKILYNTLKKGEQLATSKLTPVDVIFIREQCAQGKTNREVAKCFGVTPQCISKVKLKHSWKHIEIYL
jgi:hypothetical protein